MPRYKAIVPLWRTFTAPTTTYYSETIEDLLFNIKLIEGKPSVYNPNKVIFIIDRETDKVETLPFSGDKEDEFS